MKFCAERFNQNAPAAVRKLLLEDHRQALDGMEVINGQIDYTVDGEDYYLYPVLEEWCDE